MLSLTLVFTLTRLSLIEGLSMSPLASMFMTLTRSQCFPRNRILIGHNQNVRAISLRSLGGLGSAWPIIRGHGLLNALHAKVGSVPTVLFYPGEWDGLTLKAFSTMEGRG